MMGAIGSKMSLIGSKEYRYSALDDTRNEQEALEESTRTHMPLVRLLLLLILIVTNIATFLGTRAWIYHNWTDARVQEKLPPFMDIDRSYHVEYFSAFNFNVTHYTEKADIAGDEVEKNWADLGIYKSAVIIPEDQTRYFDFRPQNVKLNTGDIGAPYAGTPVKIQAQHYLHCVNYLRQGLYYNVDYYRRTNHPLWNAKSDKMYGTHTLAELHTAHCVDQLRQVIMCEVDLDVVPFLHDEVQETNYLDFAQKKQCRNWQSLAEWLRKSDWDGLAIPEENVPGHDGEPYYSWSGRD